jgi:ribosomal protein S18 acetylase RimI-like enzyme
LSSAAISNLLFESFKEFKELYTKDAFHATALPPESVQKRLEEGPVWVALLNGKIVGTVSLLVINREEYIRGMAVHPEARGRKIGLHLLEKVEAFAKENNCSRLFLSTTPFLDRAIKLYKKFGFEENHEGPDNLFGTP